MKKLIALLLALVMVLSLVACGGNEAPAEDPKDNEAPAADAEQPKDDGAAPVEVELWHYFDSSSDKDLIVQWIEEYNSIQDDIHITGTYMSRDELMNQYIIGAVSGELPDIGMVDSPDMASYISMGLFSELSVVVKDCL